MLEEIFHARNGAFGLVGQSKGSDCAGQPIDGATAIKAHLKILDAICVVRHAVCYVESIALLEEEANLRCRWLQTIRCAFEEDRQNNRRRVDSCVGHNLPISWMLVSLSLPHFAVCGLGWRGTRNETKGVDYDRLDYSYSKA